MKIRAYESFRRFYRELPLHIQKKTDKQIRLLAENLRHPSLQVKKIQGTVGIWEARVDLHYRMTFERTGDSIHLRVVGNHDEALKNP